MKDSNKLKDKIYTYFYEVLRGIKGVALDEFEKGNYQKAVECHMKYTHFQQAFNDVQMVVRAFDEEEEDNKEEALKFIKDLLERYEDEEL